MGAQTMGSNGMGGGGAQQPKSDGLARQGSLYNLTLDEVQNQLGDLGKPLTSMNLDEFLKSIWTAETSQGMANGTPGYSQRAQLASVSSLPRQLSLTFTPDLTNKTVDEVWKNIQQDHNNGRKVSPSNDNNSSSARNRGREVSQERQTTLGEMTLEDFLVKAGIVAESSRGKKNRASALEVDPVILRQQSGDPQQVQWMHYQHLPIQQQQQVFMPGHLQVQHSLPIMDTGYPETQMTMSPSSLMALSDTQTSGRKRVASGDVMEKTVERRQKRMIKNRESAARSRARKQAYTHELENKVSRLEEENERLKRQKEAEKVLASVPPPAPKYQLRRTSSAPL